MMTRDQDNHGAMAGSRWGSEIFLLDADVCRIRRVFTDFARFYADCPNIEQFNTVMKNISGSNKEAALNLVGFIRKCVIESVSHSLDIRQLSTDAIQEIYGSENIDFEEISEEMEMNFSKFIREYIKYEFDPQYESQGLDIEEFTEAMEVIYGSDKDIDFKAIHIKMATTSEATVSFVEFIDYLERLKNDTLNWQKPFPKPFKVVYTNCHGNIIKILFHPFSDARTDNLGSIHKRFSAGHYFTVTTSGQLTTWSEKFENPVILQIGELEESGSFFKKQGAVDMVYMPELEQLAICTNDRELLFINCFSKSVSLELRVSLENKKITCMDYWSNGFKALLSLGDQEGVLYAFISYDVTQEGIFYKSKSSSTTSLSRLLQTKSKKHMCFKEQVFQDACRQIRYFPYLGQLAICGASSKQMVLVSDPFKAKEPKKTLMSSPGQNFFTCVEHFCQHLVTGGTDGLLRLWDPHNSDTYVDILEGHVKPITNILVNEEEGILLSISKDKCVHVWTDEWKNVQSFEVNGLGLSNITSAYYNTINNELVVSSSNIAKNLGRGTDFCKKMLKSHNKPLCCALYHSILKQVVSVCQSGVVTVWDIRTGRPEVQFRVTPDHQQGHTTISFDSSQRRLITVCHDGTVQLWNFSHGKKLRVLPVRVPEKVTGIICVDSKVILSALNSKTIFDLDLEGNVHRFMEHQFLDDISGMDLRKSLLATASSNGNIVFWKYDSRHSGEAIYSINTSMSLQTFLLIGTRYQGKTGGLSARTHLCAASRETVDGNNGSLIYLKTREEDVSTAAVLTSAGGFIHAWSPEVSGGLLGKFMAVEAENAVITTMTTDVEDHFLVAGDSNGKIYVWDIRGFWSGRESLKEPFETIREWKVSLCAPPLLDSWTAHLPQVMSVTFGDKCEHIITAGLDGIVTVWTLTGSSFGTFGRDKWDSALPSLYEEDVPCQCNVKEIPKKEVYHVLDEVQKFQWVEFYNQPAISDEEVEKLYREALRIELRDRRPKGRHAFSKVKNKGKNTGK